ncbi:MAG: hypothetical protein ABIR96_02585 [Bdellovibrionota bacterium]
MKRVRRQNPIWMLGLGLVAGQPLVFATPQKPSQALEKLPQKLEPLHKSLLFDQNFDTAAVRPFLPEKVVAEYFERLESQRAPASLQEEFKVAASQIPAPLPMIAEAHPLLAQLPNLVASNADIHISNVSAPTIETLSVSIPTPAPIPVRAAVVNVVATAPAPAPVKPVAAKPVVVANERPAKDVLKDLQTENKIVIKGNDVPKLKSLESSRAGVYVIDESAFLESRFETVPGASIQWLNPDSNLSSKPNKKGLAFVPYPNAYSARYIVKAPGYLPAVGYAVKGMISPVLLYREARLGPILKSLNQATTPGQAILIGKFLSRSLRPLEKMSFDQFLRDTQTSFYSLGLFGLFHPGATESGPRGDFLINHLNFSLQYLLAKQDKGSGEISEWPAQLVDFKGLSPVLTTTLVEPKAIALSTQVVDAFTLERPETGIYASIGGQRGLVEPDSDGILDLGEVFERPSVDLIEIRAQGYMKTWLNTPALSEALPDFVPLFTQNQLDEVLQTVDETASSEQSYVIGAVRPENIRKSFEVKVFGADGHQARSAKIFYFGKENKLSTSASAVDPKDARFVISGLPEGEWHVILVDAKTGEGRGIQVVRTQRGTISQTQF